MSSSRKPLRQQVKECMRNWAEDAREEAQDGVVEGFEAYAEMAIADYGTRETKEQALVWMTQTFAEKFAELPVKHGLSVHCEDYNCARCRADVRLKRLQTACGRKL